jgi:PAS domain S-box-containing protein
MAEVSLMSKSTTTKKAVRSQKKSIKQKGQPTGIAHVLEEIGSSCETVLLHVDDGIYMLDTKGHFTFVNSVIEQRSGMSIEQFRNLHFLDIVSPDDHDRVQKNFEEVMMGKEVPPYELAYRKANGKRLAVEVNTEPLFRDGKVVGLIGISRDVTERIRIEKALRQSQEKYQLLVEHSLQGIAIAQGMPARLVFVNPALADILGYTIDELLSLPPGKGIKLIDDEYQDMFWGRYRDRIEGKSVPSRYEVVVVRRDGTKRWVELFANRIEYDGKPAVQAVFVDITERKLAREALEKAHHELEARVKERTAQLEEVNSALRVLLKQRDMDRRELEEKVMLNVKELVIPYAQKLRTNLADVKQIAYLNILESNLNDIISPFAHKLSSRYISLTPTEIQTAQLIKDGRTTKEIAELLNVSTRTVESHRQNIRIKMGLHAKRANLRSYLLSM